MPGQLGVEALAGVALPGPLERLAQARRLDRLEQVVGRVFEALLCGGDAGLASPPLVDSAPEALR